MGLEKTGCCKLCGEQVNEKYGLCRSCIQKLSPWFTGWEQADEISLRKQLAAREKNTKAAAAFHITYTIGDGIRVLLDEDAETFMVTAAQEGDLKKINPDVIPIAAVKSCRMEIEENCQELPRQEGKAGTYHRRYQHNYRFIMRIGLQHPYLTEIRYPLNSQLLQIQCDEPACTGTGMFVPARHAEYRRYLDMADEIADALIGEEEEL